jgi:hypothetical protein
MTEQKDLKINSGRVLTDNELIAQFMGLPLVKTLPRRIARLLHWCRLLAAFAHT